MDLKAAIIGAGRPWKSEGATGSGISHNHARGYAACSRTELVAVADIVAENAQAFSAEHGGEVFTDYKQMLADVRPDIVSICTWPHLHEPMVLACAEAGIRAVHCEKPMAPSLAAARRMVEACRASGTQLTFNHQRRFDAAYVAAEQMLDSGVIGKLVRMEMPTANLFDWGTHWFDMMFFYNRQTPAEWVLAQVEPTGGPTVFGVKLEGQAISMIRFANGVMGLIPTGEVGWGVQNRIVGESGVIEIGATGWDTLRVWGKGQSDWQDVPTTPTDPFALGFADIAACLDTGREPELSARKAMMATELIFASYESARRGGRVSLPLDVADAEILSA